MESRRQRITPSSGRKLKTKATTKAGKNSPAALSLPAIADFRLDALELSPHN